MGKWLGLVYLLAVLSGLSACKSTKKSKDASKQAAVPAEKPAIKSSFDAWPTPYWTAKAKVTVLVGDNNIPVSVTMRAIENEAVWFSAQALGLLEVARGRIDRDSVRIWDKMNSRCYYGASNELGALFPVSVELRHMQHLLMGRVFWDSLTAGERIARNDTQLVSGSLGELNYSVELFQTYRLLIAQGKNADSRFEVFMQNEDFKMVKDYPVSFKKEIRSLSRERGEIQQNKVKIEFNRFDFVDEKPETTLDIPSSVNRIPIR
jgi:hypothetical protein